MKSQYDVAICGGGLAGLTLARQLTRRAPDLDIVVLEKQRRPLPEAAFKVGESTVVAGANYLTEALGLREYIERNHISKLGLRYFFPPPSPGARFEARPELGRSRYLRGIEEWQLDRGIFENDLREMVAEAGVELVEGVTVKDVERNGEEPHRIAFTEVSGSRRGDEVRARWVIDATSRRRILQKKIGLKRKRGLRYSACWFRVPGRLDVDDFVPPAERAWHERVAYGDHPTDPTYGRYNSTTHLVGRGYWVWLIPLSSGTTSVGIVCLEREHPAEQYHNYPKALAWLREHEPEVAARLGEDEPLDFRFLRDYTYFSEQILSAQRWALTGEAGWFADPFYSPGTDSIAYANSLICEAIVLDRRGALRPELCQALDEEYRQWGENLTQLIQSGYPLFGDPVTGALKVIVDLSFGFGLNVPVFSSAIFKPGFAEEMERWATRDRAVRIQNTQALSVALTHLLRDWNERGSERVSFEWMDYFAFPFLRDLALRSVVAERDPADQLEHACGVLRQLAVAILYVATADAHPDALPRLERARSINPWAMSFDPGLWEENGLFDEGPGSVRVELVREGVLAELWTQLRLDADAPAARHATNSNQEG